MFLLVSALCLLAACNLPVDLLPTVTTAPESTSTAESDWQAIADGLQWRSLIPHGDRLAQLIVLRVNPNQYRFRAIYRAGEPESLPGWRALEPDASVIVNANFFDSNHEVLGLVISDGLAHGTAYRDRGGTFLIRNGEPVVVANRPQTLRTDGSIQQAIQGFPLLVENGRQAYFTTSSGERTRRTLIGIDKNENILIMVSPFLGLSLADLSAYLPRTDLEIETAFNLDGGGSTMIALPGADYFQPSIDPVPATLALYPRASG